MSADRRTLLRMIDHCETQKHRDVAFWNRLIATYRRILEVGDPEGAAPGG